MVNLFLMAVILVLCVLIVRGMRSNNQAYTENIRAEQDFLAENRNQEGIGQTPSGLQYSVLTSGTSQDKVNANDTVQVHYEGRLLDGSVFDSSYKRGEPVFFSLKQVIPGWQEGLQLMAPGDKYRLFIPHKLAYGKKRAGLIAPGSMLIFDIELLDKKSPSN